MVCITVILCGILFWPTLYRYDKIKSTLVRVNRLTGDTEILSTADRKWYTARKFRPEDYSIHPPLLPASEKAKLIGEKLYGELYEIGKSSLPISSFVTIPNKNNFNFRSELYNGSDWNILELIVVIEAKNKDDTTRWKRRYKANIIGEAINIFSSGSITVEPSDAYGVATYIWFIDEAYGSPNK